MIRRLARWLDRQWQAWSDAAPGYDYPEYGCDEVR